MNMTDKETLSALLDNEADDLELRRLLKSLELDSDASEILEAWERMNLVQAVLHDEKHMSAIKPRRLSENFSQKVAAAIALESVPVNSNIGKVDPIKWGQFLTKFGIAASVALAFFLGMQISVDPARMQNPTTNQIAQNPDSGAPDLVANPTNQDYSLLANSPVQQVNPQARQRLEEYIRSVSITPEDPVQLEQLQDSPLYRLVNEIKVEQ